MKGPLLRALLAGALLASEALGVDVLETVGFSSCNTNASVSVQRIDIKYNNDNKTVTFDVAGTSNQIQNVTAILNVTAYGQNIYSNSFDPCDQKTFVQQLCPVPAGTFAAKGTQKIPDEYAKLVPAIAFQIPDIAAMATLQLRSRESGERVACIQSEVSNGKTASVPAVSYVAASVAGAALVLGGVSAVGAAFASGGSAAASGGSAAGGMGTISPSFTEVFGWFQGMAMNGMLSVNYPNVYRSFAKNFGFSTGLIPWTQLQVSIDGFRAVTGGNLTNNSVESLRNATLVFPDGSSETTGQGLFRRAVDEFVQLAARQIETSINGTVDETAQQGGPKDTVRVAVSGIQGYVEQLSIPSGNTFMTVLLVVAIIIAAIVVGILLVKVVLEFWALFGSFPKALAGFRKHYWGSIARTVTSLILLLYGIWVLYCMFQFTRGDSWAAKVLAGVTLALFTGILAFFSWKIWSTARKLRKLEGDIGALYDDKSIWVKYSLFYESYRRDYWWIFVPVIVYMFAKSCVLAVGDGHGMAQTIGQLVIEAVMLILLVWSRPYERRSSNIINIAIAVVRVLSVACILVFVEEFGIAQTTQTVTGVVLIAVQSALTGVLALLIAWNALIACCKQNPHRKRRKEMEKMQQRDTLTPLDARNSLLLDRKHSPSSSVSSTLSLTKTGFAVTTTDTTTTARSTSPDRYDNNNTGRTTNGNPNPMPNPMFAAARPLMPTTNANPTAGLATPSPGPGQRRDFMAASRENLVMGGEAGGGDVLRQPTLPNVGYGGYAAAAPRGYPSRERGYPAPSQGRGGGYGQGPAQGQGGGQGRYDGYRGGYGRY